MQKRGKLVIVNGPSGSGKGRLVAHARSVYPSIVFSISCTTRTPRPGEVHGTHYHFISVEEFEKGIAQGDFLEWAKFGDKYYGTLKSEVLPLLDQGKVVILEIEIQGAHQIMEMMSKDDLLTIFVDAGSWETLERRIRARAPISDEEVAKRRASYAMEVGFKDEADVVIENPDGALEEANQKIVDVLAPLFSAA